MLFVLVILAAKLQTILTMEMVYMEWLKFIHPCKWIDKFFWDNDLSYKVENSILKKTEPSFFEYKGVREVIVIYGGGNESFEANINEKICVFLAPAQNFWDPPSFLNFCHLTLKIPPGDSPLMVQIKISDSPSRP